MPDHPIGGMVTVPNAVRHYTKSESLGYHNRVPDGFIHQEHNAALLRDMSRERI
jgi:hypothetical protein